MDERNRHSPDPRQTATTDPENAPAEDRGEEVEPEALDEASLEHVMRECAL